MTKPKRDEEGKIPRITKTCRVVLEGDGVRMDAGEFMLIEPEPGPQRSDFADAAFKAGRSSYSRLMAHAYRLVVIDGDVEEGYGLTTWIKLVDGSKQVGEDAPSGRKQRIRRGKLAA